MPETTLTSGNSVGIGGTAEVKVTNQSAATAGSFSVQCPNVPLANETIAAGGSKNIQIPIGTSTFANTGTPALKLSW